MVRSGWLLGLLLLAAAAPAAPPTAPPAPPAAAATAPAPAAHPPATPAKPAVHEHMHASDATGVLGRDVHDSKGDDIGHIVNVLVDPEGLPRAAVIEFGGFLGVGTRRIAVAWRALEFPTTGNGPATLDMSVDQIKATPEYHPAAGDTPITVAAPPLAAPPAPQSH